MERRWSSTLRTSNKNDTCNTPNIPGFDKALSTRNICVTGLFITWALSLGSLAFAAYSLDIGQTWEANLQRLSHSLREFMPLLFNIAITACIDCVGYIHSTSLRWALWEDKKRLRFNSNIRLFTNAPNCAPNSYVSNAMSACCLIFCYVGSSQAFVYTSSDGEVTGLELNSIAVLMLGIGLFGLVFISTWSLYMGPRIIHTWSSNPLNVCLAALHDGLERQTGRCMLNAAALETQPADSPVRPVSPSRRQPSARVTNPGVKWVNRLLWLLLLITIVWASIITRLTIQLRSPVKDWDFFTQFTSATFLNDNISLHIGTTRWSRVLQSVLALLFIAVIQPCLTLGLHSIELIVNISRDEDAWRSAATPIPIKGSGLATESNRGKGMRGARLNMSSITTAVTSWQTIGLFIFKPITHWLFGLGMVVYADDYYGSEIIFRPIPLWALAACALFISLSVTWMVRYKPRGPQPAAYGHLQTLANLVDDWGTGEDTTLYWGDKGENGNGSRHAGTSSSRDQVDDIRMDFLYE